MTNGKSVDYVKRQPFANLIALQSASEADAISFQEEELSLEEGQLTPLQTYKRGLREQISRELGTHHSHLFIEYGWNGFSNEPPWSIDQLTQFDPRLISVIIPETGKTIQIRGEDRRILLTFPPSYRGAVPFYNIVCPDYQQSHNIRILNPLVGRPFAGIERIFSPNGFDSLPRLSDYRKSGLILQNKQLITVPANSTEIF